MSELESRLLATLNSRHYKPLTLKALARRLGLVSGNDREFRKVVRGLVQTGRAQFDRDHQLRATPPHGTVVGLFRRTHSGRGVVRAHHGQAHRVAQEIAIAEHDCLDAANGDEVLVKLAKKPSRTEAYATGEVVKVLQRNTRNFVGTYYEHREQGYVRVVGTQFPQGIWVGDPGAKGAKPDDQVVIEMLRFPTLTDERGQAVITEVLGERGKPGVDVLMVIRSHDLPDAFPEDVLADARHQAELFHEDDFSGRTDFTQSLVISIDPIDARDFDDAVALHKDAKTGNWVLEVHVADVAHFVPPGSPLDREARRRGTSVYLPGRVLPMIPELISNGLASLQQDRVRYVRTAVLEFQPDGTPVSADFHNGVIRNRRRFTYEEVSEFLAKPEAVGDEQLAPELRQTLLNMRELAIMLRARRFKRGALELTMPEAVLEYDSEGKVSGAHLAVHDISHQIIEEFMLAANTAVATLFHDRKIATMRRIHPAPEPSALEQFADFVNHLGYRVKRSQDRFELQRVLEHSRIKGEAPAVHYALLRSLKQAQYGPMEEEHYALAIEHYCHFTSPIRRYPDLVVHRMLAQLIAGRRPGSDVSELTALGDQCSRLERRAEKAERELVRLKLLTFLSTRIGMQMPATITSVSEYGFFAVGNHLPVDGMVHISTLEDDYYYFDDATHTLSASKGKKRYRLGDTITVEILRVDLTKRTLDLKAARPPRASV
ncbi:ribonuclease R [Tuwongella immobilis]|uniref:Ribonuclease R n=1 Tax=Tuwongella immobilis TaxID=692036 RepID=A0A6C2YSP9_9BACT|nr:ribonuclease R [Tuwongella immobilis]VIP03902.1 ribonuclease r : Ribonuclease R OS=Singulisphaera acidiphila (strain ATCC BAA-1392 / DSM 18658 / VKM B-2454 / MOB10) GN=rnr PE=3 SV=1: RNB: S1 [Tuwongella immobilis]VTS05171.1 ribonuclease r : Ribonuclease R OS=Singulisphaera acidiphila (strain ATCC BAA-1392 / DSM 18658 / VKM B-2454 / MOB10) GN=rnr PE=3 SV=1: RNB: S1 [Tuwongella immobilis]